MAKVKIIFDMKPEEKKWIETIVLKPGQTKIALFREMLDKYAEEKGLPPRP